MSGASVETCHTNFFFFSSRRRHTRFDCDWSSDVCSSDLYRLQAPAGLVTTGSCAGVQGEQEAEDEGEGEDEQHDEMSFVDKQQPEENGTLIYHDPGQSLDVTSSNGVRSISYSGNCVSFIGDAKLNGQLGYQFIFRACDFSATGGIGSFSISLTGPAGYSYRKNGTLTTGFVKLHQVVQP